MKFFDTTPTGRILNRFSKDMDEGISPCFFYALEHKPELAVPSSLLDDSLDVHRIYSALDAESKVAAGVHTRNILVLAFSPGFNLYLGWGSIWFFTFYPTFLFDLI